MRTFGSGSSPLARGTRDPAFDAGRGPRLIPARAGNTRGTSARSCGGAAHPRSRGEHVLAGAVAPPRVGSSPLARGTPFSIPSHHKKHRLIPARAGNTYLIITPNSMTAAHPRSRGEHWVEDDDENIYRGSSPLARGTRVPPYSETQTYRLIPARAGNTTGGRKPRCYWAAHPRSRGEHFVVFPDFGCGGGSSPLARGTLVRGRVWRRHGRLIPARAGNTRRVCAWTARRSAHPRSRGEHFRRSMRAEA